MSSCAIPLELILLIFENVEQDRDLFRLASSSRLFNQLALDTYFIRHKITDVQPPYKSLFLDLYPLRSTSGCLQAMLLSIDLPRMQFTMLGYHYTQNTNLEKLAREVELFTRLINAVGQVADLRLHLLAFPVQSSVVGRANAQLLDSVHRHSGIRVLQVSSDCDEFEAPGYYPPEQHSQRQQQVSRRDGSVAHLTLHSFPYCLRRFYLDTLTINHLSLTHLHVSGILPKPKKALVALLKDIHLPRLYDVHFSDCHHNHHVPILKFMSRHATLAYIRYQVDKNIYGRHPSCFPSLLQTTVLHHAWCKNIYQLQVNIQYVHYFLSSESQMPALKNITLYNIHSAYLMGRKVFDEALSSLQHCPAGINLTLMSLPYSCDLGMWFSNFPFCDSYRPERVLTCIRSLNLEHNHTGFDPKLLGLLPKWFALFPALEEIELWAYSLQSTSKSDTFPRHLAMKMVEEVKQRCGTVSKLSMVSGLMRKNWDS